MLNWRWFKYMENTKKTKKVKVTRTINGDNFLNTIVLNQIAQAKKEEIVINLGG